MKQPHRSTWPRGLRIIFYFSILSILVSLPQLYDLLVSNEVSLSPLTTMPGSYILVSMAMGITCIVLGTMSRRRAFARVVLITAAVHLSMELKSSFRLWTLVFPGVLRATTRDLRDFLNEWGLLLAWYSFAILVNFLIGYYLLHYELKWFRRQEK